MSDDLSRKVRVAIRHFWKIRKSQSKKQKTSGKKDQGARGAVTGGAQLDGFINLVSKLLIDNGIPKECIFCKKRIVLPGYFRPTKEWDLLVVHDSNLIASIEFKSHIGPSFGNNYNNRTEEALGSATDIWTAYREGVFKESIRPWLGFFILLEDHPKSTCPISVREPHFNILDEFRDSSYAERYEIYCRKLIRERLYDAACLILSDQDKGPKGNYREPSLELGFDTFAASLTGKAIAYMKTRTKSKKKSK